MALLHHRWDDLLPFFTIKYKCDRSFKRCSNGPVTSDMQTNWVLRSTLTYGLCDWKTVHEKLNKWRVIYIFRWKIKMLQLHHTHNLPQSKNKERIESFQQISHFCYFRSNQIGMQVPIDHVTVWPLQTVKTINYSYSFPVLTNNNRNKSRMQNDRILQISIHVHAWERRKKSRAKISKYHLVLVNCANCVGYRGNRNREREKNVTVFNIFVFVVINWVLFVVWPCPCPFSVYKNVLVCGE